MKERIQPNLMEHLQLEHIIVSESRPWTAIFLKQNGQNHGGNWNIGLNYIEVFGTLGREFSASGIFTHSRALFQFRIGIH
jgi:hypothetical protein